MAHGLVQVGHTRYKTPILSHVPLDQEFDEERHLQKFQAQEEIFDAYALFEFLSTREYRRNQKNRFFGRYREQADAYLQKLNSWGILEKCKIELNITDAFKLNAYGKSLALAEFTS